MEAVIRLNKVIASFSFTSPVFFFVSRRFISSLYYCYTTRMATGKGETQEQSHNEDLLPKDSPPFIYMYV